MTRMNLFRATTLRNIPSTLRSVAWGKRNLTNSFDTTTSTMIFAALLIACSLTVGCSSDQPKPVSSNNQSAITPPTPPMTTASTPPPATPAPQAAAKPVHKKTARKVSPTVMYVNDSSGISFEYPRKFALKTGDAASELLSSGPIPMDFVQPGGIALAAVALPESTYPNSDLASAFFNVSVNKTLTTDQCSEFSVAQPSSATLTDPTEQTTKPATPPVSKSISKLIIGDMELQSSETNVGSQTSTGPREEAAKYYHVFQNGACYEFALKVATTKLEATTTTESTIKHIDRDEVFHRLEQILATVKINPVTAPEVNAEAKTPVQPTSVETPAP